MTRFQARLLTSTRVILWAVSETCTWKASACWMGGTSCWMDTVLVPAAERRLYVYTGVHIIRDRTYAPKSYKYGNQTEICV